jgi:stalled ribosome rescue protein Dom34
MTSHHYIVWIDSNEARILRVENGLQPESTIRAPVAQIVPTLPTGNDGSAGDPSAFFHQVARALDTADEILIVGPSTTKGEFAKYLHKNDHAFDPRILGVETIEHPSASQLAGYAKLYFISGGPRRTGNGSGHKGTD